jgi:hypothetical protein
VAYDLELHEQNVRPFLEDQTRVSPAVREIIERNLKEDLGENGDFYCLNEGYRIRGSSSFWYDLILTDPATARRRHFWFVVSDAVAQFGVLRVLWAEERT